MGKESPPTWEFVDQANMAADAWRTATYTLTINGNQLILKEKRANGEEHDHTMDDISSLTATKTSWQVKKGSTSWTLTRQTTNALSAADLESFPNLQIFEKDLDLVLDPILNGKEKEQQQRQQQPFIFL